jgi:hypothetical protein
MNNEQFRKLLGHTPVNPQNGSASTPRPGATPGAMLGSRTKSSVPMTPRSVLAKGGVDFARQLAERNAGPEKSKRFRSAAPKGSRLAEGYRDRTQERADEEADDKARRIKALEDALKLQQIDEPTFTRLRDEITGGDISSTHLVKGLDWKLLDRVKRGENVLETAPNKPEEETNEEEKDLDAEFDELEKQEVVPVAREEKLKKGSMAPPPLVAGQKRTRDQILAELKASRKAQAAAAIPKLGAKFKKIGEARETSRIERDEKGREILITTDAEGNVKRKVRKVTYDTPEVDLAPLLDLDPNQKPLGIDVPDIPIAAEEEDDEDIFEGVGHDFNPLAALDNDEASSSEDEYTEKIVPKDISLDDGEISENRSRLRSRPLSKSRSRSHSRSRSRSISSSPSSSPSNSAEVDAATSATEASTTRNSIPISVTPRNYFNDDPSTLSVLGNLQNPLKDPSLLAALANSRKLDPDRMVTDANPPSVEEAARLARRAAMISNHDRDLEDMDMGFGSSRFDDAEEMANEGERVKFSQWKGLGDDYGDEDEEGGKKKGKGAGEKRKRAPKKRKGDKDSAADVLSVMKSQKAKKEAAAKPIG